MRKTRVLAVFLILTSVVSCVPPSPRPAVLPPTADLAQKTAEAEALYIEGSFVALKKALRNYRQAYDHPSLSRRIAQPFLKAAILLALREKEVGIVDSGALDQAHALIKDNPGLGSMKLCLEMAASLEARHHGTVVAMGINVPSWLTRSREEVQADFLAKKDALRQLARSDVFFAYLFHAWTEAMTPRYEKMEDVSDIMSSHAGSAMMRFRSGIGPVVDRQRLEDLLKSNPEFAEVGYYLGNAELEKGYLLGAEKQYRRVYEVIPESPEITILLAGIALAMEDLERGLEFYDKTLALKPEYRDALLGKAICLSFLGRSSEARSVCDRMIELGFWMLGEAYYWRARNSHELKELASAVEEIEQSKSRLPTQSDVWGLSGTIKAELGDSTAAEAEFLKALEYNDSNSEALSGLGNVYARKELWSASAASYEKAAVVFQGNEDAIRDRIEEIEAADLDGERKARLLAKMDRKLKTTQASEAQAYFLAAASAIRAGDPALAERMANQAALHPAFKQQAERLLESIRR